MISLIYPLTMICFGIYIGTYNDCKPSIEYIHEVISSMCRDPNESEDESEHEARHTDRGTMTEETQFKDD